MDRWLSASTWIVQKFETRPGMYEHRICLLWRNCWRNVEDLRYENLMQVLIHFLKPNFVIKRGSFQFQTFWNWFDYLCQQAHDDGKEICVINLDKTSVHRCALREIKHNSPWGWWIIYHFFRPMNFWTKMIFFDCYLALVALHASIGSSRWFGCGIWHASITTRCCPPPPDGF